MAIDERRRHELYLRLEDVLGTDEASTLMEHMPPVGWADVTTKSDLEHLRATLTAELRAEFRGALITTQRNLFFAMIGAIFTTASVSIAAASLI